MSGKKRIFYYYDEDITRISYGTKHPMKPFRIRKCHNIVQEYGLFNDMTIIRPTRATEADMEYFHTKQYIQFLSSVNMTNRDNFQEVMETFNVGTEIDLDCPLFGNLFKFCQLSTGGSLYAARALNNNEADIAINWMGGLHHAHEAQAYGFCYVNDAVLAILELLKEHKRVLYVDIDLHHGDGVEQAFYTTDRVMTVSFHRYEYDEDSGNGFFPRTGSITDIGVGEGSFYTVNVPLKKGITDESYERLFRSVMEKVMESFRPEAVVLQCGADSLSGDPISGPFGGFNLTLKGHGECVNFFKQRNVPLILLGGGGYDPENVARCWAYETSLAVGKEIRDDCLHSIKAGTGRDENTSDYLCSIKTPIFENLRHLQGPPGVQMQSLADFTFRSIFTPVPFDFSRIDDDN